MRHSDWRRPARIAPGTFAAVIRAYLGSPKFAELEPTTQRSYRRVLSLAEHPEALGALSTLSIRPALVQAFLDGLAQTPGKQTIARTAIKAVEKYAVVRDLLPYPITTGTEVVRADGGHEPWSDAHIALGLAQARPDLARVIALAYHTGQRGSDIVRMRWADIEQQDERSGINVVQRKTGVRLWIPFTRDLAATIETWSRERKPPFFLVLKPDGEPYTRELLSWHWNEQRDTDPALAPLKAAGLVLHGLRASAVIRARRSGATTLEISSMYGMSLPMVTRYSRFADQRNQALAAVHRIDGTSAERRAAKDIK